ncbi:hypothetical protein V6N12_043027 [Hibiscus sabdariffa]|uniref:Uncharacterized protein n=1 Tax=Hibiscus sabdariffa TaxID=183260 RepID=A0ABR2DI06_9ROSI
MSHIAFSRDMAITPSSFVMNHASQEKPRYSNAALNPLPSTQNLSPVPLQAELELVQPLVLKLKISYPKLTLPPSYQSDLAP